MQLEAWKNMINRLVATMLFYIRCFLRGSNTIIWDGLNNIFTRINRTICNNTRKQTTIISCKRKTSINSTIIRRRENKKVMMNLIWCYINLINNYESEWYEKQLKYNEFLDVRDAFRITIPFWSTIQLSL